MPRSREYSSRAVYNPMFQLLFSSSSSLRIYFIIFTQITRTESLHDVKEDYPGGEALRTKFDQCLLSFMLASLLAQIRLT
jgi:hypothetical protein